MAPYWLQGTNAPLTDIFSSNNGWEGSRYIITFGALTSLSTALLGSLFPLPRVLFAMSSDGKSVRCWVIDHPIYLWNIANRSNAAIRFVSGLLPTIFKSTVGRKKTPVFSTIFSGLFAGIMAALFNTDELMDMMSIGTLLAYTLVAISVLILR